MFRILIVDQNITRANLTNQAIRNLKFGCRVNYALSATQTLIYVAGSRGSNKVLPDMIIINEQLPDATALDTLASLIEALQPEAVPIIISSDEPRSEHSTDYYKKGAIAYVAVHRGPEYYMAAMESTIRFVAMLSGLVPKQPQFFPEKSSVPTSIRDILQVHL